MPLGDIEASNIPNNDFVVLGTEQRARLLSRHLTGREFARVKSIMHHLSMVASIPESLMLRAGDC
jgi:hypothetical protein